MHVTDGQAEIVGHYPAKYDILEVLQLVFELN